MFLPEIAERRGTSATHPNHPRLYGGNERISKTLDRRDARTGSKERGISTIRNTDIFLFTKWRKSISRLLQKLPVDLFSP
jgi:hypothetical protein